MSARRKPISPAEAGKAERIATSGTKKPAQRKPLARHLVSADGFANPEEAAEWLAELPVAPSLLDRFSAEQLIQIRRLTCTGNFADTDETIATLAAATLFMFGLDPIARGAFDQVSSVVYGNGSADEYLINVLINERAGEEWTKAQRAAEREAALKGRATAYTSA